MSASKNIKVVLTKKNIKPGAVADALGVDRQVFYNKLSRDTMKYNDVEKIADALGCDIVFKDKQTNEIY
jgi:hypothetical protein